MYWQKKYGGVTLGMCLLLLQGVARADGYFDVLDQPARVSALAASSALSGVARAGARLVAVGQRGHIVYSDDGGQHWQQAAVPVSCDLTAVNFSSPSQGWAVGNDGVILHSSDGGVTWRKQLDGRQIGPLLEQGADKPLLDVWFANDQLGYAVGVFNLILRTTDGGKHWMPFQDRTDNPQGFHLNAIAATGDALYIAGEQGLLRKWDAAQQRFVAVPTPYQGSFFGVLGKPGEVIAYGLRGNLLRSTDGGRNWIAQDSGLHTSITAGFVDTDGHYRLFTQGGQMLVSQGNGAQLQWRHEPEPLPVTGAAQTADGVMLVVGTRGVSTLRKE